MLHPRKMRAFSFKPSQNITDEAIQIEMQESCIVKREREQTLELNRQTKGVNCTAEKVQFHVCKSLISTMVLWMNRDADERTTKRVYRQISIIPTP